MQNSEKVLEQPSEAQIQRLKSYKKIKKISKKVGHSLVGRGISEVVELTEDAGKSIARAIESYLGVDVWRNEDLTLFQKIISGLGTLVVGATAIPTMVTMACGASALIPPLMLSVSVAGLFRDVTFLYQKSELNNIRNKLISHDKLEQLINECKYLKKNHAQSDMTQLVLLYTFAPQEIYAELYAVRERIMTHSSIALADKLQMVQHFNKLIEELSNKEIQDLSDVLKDKLPSDINLVRLEELVYQYRFACDAVDSPNKLKQINMGRDLRNKITAFKTTQNKIYSQDLPENVKKTLLKLISLDTVNQDDLQLLYAQLGNHYINRNTRDQINAQDHSHNELIAKSIKNKANQNMLEKYYLLPREIFQNLSNVEVQLDNCAFKNEREKDKIFDQYHEFFRFFIDRGYIELNQLSELCKYSNNIATVFSQCRTYEERLQASERSFKSVINDAIKDCLVLHGKLGTAIADKILNSKFKNIDLSDDAFDKVCSEIVAYFKDKPTVFENVKDKLNDIRYLYKSLTMHRLASLQQYAYGQEFQFESPNIMFTSDGNSISKKFDELVENNRFCKRIKDKGHKIIAEFDAKVEETKDEIIQALLGKKYLEEHKNRQALKQAVTSSKSSIKQDLSNKFDGTFNLIQKTQRKQSLEKSIPRRVLGLTLDATATTMNAAATIIFVAGAPTYGALSVVGSVLSAAAAVPTTASYLNDYQVAKDRRQDEKKIVEARLQINDAVAPDITADIKALRKDKSTNKVAAKSKSDDLIEKVTQNKQNYFNNKIIIGFAPIVVGAAIFFNPWTAIISTFVCTIAGIVINHYRNEYINNSIKELSSSNIKFNPEEIKSVKQGLTDQRSFMPQWGSATWKYPKAYYFGLYGTQSEIQDKISSDILVESVDTQEMLVSKAQITLNNLSSNMSKIKVSKIT
jgi:hypothetical protein